MVSLDNNSLLAKPLAPSGYTFTLASRFAQLLHLAEERFGARDRSFTFAGIEFNGEYPQTWYPYDRKDIIIQLTPNCLHDAFQGCYQLAHEIIHLLSPVKGTVTNVLEEGLAVHFSKRFVEGEFRREMRETLQSYTRALQLVESLLAIEPNAIKLLRVRQPTIRLITASDIRSIREDIPEILAEELTKPFERSLS